MNAPEASAPRILIIPHVPVLGGAGLYNAAAISSLARTANVRLLGPHAACYEGASRGDAETALPQRPIIPAYAGASRKSFLYYAMLAPWRAIRLYRWVKHNRSFLSEYDALIATSSIDLATIAVVRRAIGSVRLICIVQENARLDGVRGWLNRWLLRRTDDIISITWSWSARAAAHRIRTTLARNPFDVPQVPQSTHDLAATYDIVFMGGGERIKGFDQFLSIIEKLAAQRTIRACLLGPLNASQVAALTHLAEAVAKTGSSLVAPGFVSSTATYLSNSKLLLLPIREPHFCRPAIEAGLRGRTFIVSDLEELEDFAHPGENCATAQPGSVDDWVQTCRELLDDDTRRSELAAANQDLARECFSSENFDRAYLELAARCR